MGSFLVSLFSRDRSLFNSLLFYNDFKDNFINLSLLFFSDNFISIQINFYSVSIFYFKSIFEF